MIHPIVNLPSAGPFESSFVEGVWAAAWQPRYSGVGYVDERYRGLDSMAGAVNLQPTSGGRFDPYPQPSAIPAERPILVKIGVFSSTNLQSPLQTYCLSPIRGAIQ